MLGVPDLLVVTMLVVTEVVKTVIAHALAAEAKISCPGTSRANATTTPTAETV